MSDVYKAMSVLHRREEDLRSLKRRAEMLWSQVLEGDKDAEKLYWDLKKQIRDLEDAD